MGADPCMFCGEAPCACPGKKPTKKLQRKPLPKSEPVEKEPKAEKPKPKASPRPAPSLKRESKIDPELEQVLRTLDFFDMLHPDEQKKYEQYLNVPPTTGRLVDDDLSGEAVRAEPDAEDQ